MQQEKNKILSRTTNLIAMQEYIDSFAQMNEFHRQFQKKLGLHPDLPAREINDEKMFLSAELVNLSEEKLEKYILHKMPDQSHQDEFRKKLAVLKIESAKYRELETLSKGIFSAKLDKAVSDFIDDHKLENSIRKTNLLKGQLEFLKTVWTKFPEKKDDEISQKATTTIDILNSQIEQSVSKLCDFDPTAINRLDDILTVPDIKASFSVPPKQSTTYSSSGSSSSSASYSSSQSSGILEMVTNLGRPISEAELSKLGLDLSTLTQGQPAFNLNFIPTRGDHFPKKLPEYSLYEINSSSSSSSSSVLSSSSFLKLDEKASDNNIFEKYIFGLQNLRKQAQQFLKELNQFSGDQKIVNLKLIDKELNQLIHSETKLDYLVKTHPNPVIAHAYGDKIKKLRKAFGIDLGTIFDAMTKKSNNIVDIYQSMATPTIPAIISVQEQFTLLLKFVDHLPVVQQTASFIMNVKISLISVEQDLEKQLTKQNPADGEETEDEMDEEDQQVLQAALALSKVSPESPAKASAAIGLLAPKKPRPTKSEPNSPLTEGPAPLNRPRSHSFPR